MIKHLKVSFSMLSWFAPKSFQLTYHNVELIYYHLFRSISIDWYICYFLTSHFICRYDSLWLKFRYWPIVCHKRCVSLVFPPTRQNGYNVSKTYYLFHCVFFLICFCIDMYVYYMICGSHCLLTAVKPLGWTVLFFFLFKRQMIFVL